MSLLSDLSEQLKRVQIAALNDAVLTRQDLVEALAAIPRSGISLAVRMTYRDRTISTMSFIWHRDERRAALVDDRVALQKRWSQLFHTAGVAGIEQARGVFCEVLAIGDSNELAQIARSAADIGDVVFRQSLMARNVGRDLRAALLHRLVQEIDAGHIDDISSLAMFLSRNLRLRIEVGVREGSEVRPLSASRVTDHTFKRLFASTDFLDRLREAIDEGKPVDCELADPDGGQPERLSKFLVMPVYARADPGLKRSEVLVIRQSTANGLPGHEIISSINRAFDLFLARKYRTGQIDALTLLTREIEKGLISKPLSGYDDFQGRLRAALNVIAPSVIASTAAYSVAVMQYRPHRGDLLPFFVHEHHSAPKRPEPSDLLEHEQTIALKLWRNWLSAFAFHFADTFESVYVENLRNIPHEYKRLGLSSVSSRRQPGSEIAVPIRRGNFVVGIVNFEAKQTHAFDSDQTFLKSIASGIGSLITSMHQSSDATWALDNIETHEFLHGLRNAQAAGALDGYLADTREQLHRLAGKTSSLSGERSLLRLLVDVLDFLTRGYALLGTSELAQLRQAEAERFFHFKLNDDIALSERRAKGIQIILKNLCENWLLKGDRRNDRLRVSVEHDRLSNTEWLRIQSTFHNWIAMDETTDRAFLAPIEREGRLHLGLYTVGATTRSLRGVLDFTRQPDLVGNGSTGRYQLNISIPLH